MGAPFPPVPNVVQVALSGTTVDDIFENTVFVQYGGSTPTAASLNTYGNNVAASWAAHMAAEQINTVTLKAVTVTDLASNTGAQAVVPANAPGTRGDDPIPQNAAFLISYPSSLRFRGGHFRSYLLVGGHSDMDGFNWHGAFVNEVVSHWTGFLNDITSTAAGGTTFSAHVGVKRHGKYLPNAGPPHYVLTTPIVIPLPTNQINGHAQIASQKGRINRRSK